MQAAVSHWLARLSPYAWAAAVLLWASSVVIWLDRFVDLAPVPIRQWLNDWHVYAAGGRDLLAGTLYQVPLVSDYPIPVDAFNLPPASAAMAVPLLALPDQVAGTLFVILGIAAVAATAVLTARIVGARHVWLWSGAAFFLYSYGDWLPAAFLGNNTSIVLLFVAAALAAHLASRPTLGGVLLGVAIASKLWPAALLVPLARERSWRTLGWAIGTAGAIFLAALLWLGGLDALRGMVAALSTDVEPRPRQVLLGFTWLRVHTDWWPEWGGYVVALLLLLVPARGLTGYGLATLAGMAAIPNLWRHYLTTVAFGAVLLVAGLWRGRRARAGAATPVAEAAAEGRARVQPAEPDGALSGGKAAPNPDLGP
jgi:hypothetical protein